MKIKRLNTFCLMALCFIAVQVNAYCQNPILDWTAQSDQLTINDVVTTTNSNLSKENDTIVWEQTMGDVTEMNTFMVEQVTGSWDTQSSTGNLIYTMTLDGLECHLQIVSSGNGVTMVLSIFQDNEPDFYNFPIHTFTPF